MSMKVGLINIEPKIVNSAYMRISSFHKQYGDTVEWFNTQNNYDKVYCSKLFNFTPTQEDAPKNTICGGSGISLKKNLPKRVEKCDYDYTIYPDCNFSLVWFSKGCVRNCPFCIVREKEGYICPLEPKNLNPNGTYIKIQDNNFFASPEWEEAIQTLQKWNQPVEFAGGIDVRTLYKPHCDALNLFKKKPYGIKIAWDNPKEKTDKHIERVLKYIRPYRLMCFVLIGYWSTSEQDLMRVERLRELKVDPFAMPYDKQDKYQKRFARWVNHKAIFKSVAWKDYK